MMRLLALCCCTFFTLTAHAQDGLRSPADFLGYELGERFTPHHRVLAYVHHVAEAVPHLKVEQYGETYEGRPLVTVTLSSPENMAQLETIRRNNLRRAGMEDGEIAGATAAVVWLSYNVHGNESVSTEAAMATLYDLADATNARTQAWLENTVVILDPCINPDGRDRYVYGYNRAVGRFPNANPDAREHGEAWPGGRTNHYYFDLNRDWSWLSQQETQHRIRHYHRWMPHVHVDFHEQGVESPYFFAPAAEPLHKDITPWQRQFQVTIGENHAGYFDANGWLYFTRQIFDLLYPGYGDTWPTFNGAVGMTYEQAGGGRAGLGIATAEGDTLTLRDRIDHHHTTGLSTVEVTARHADAVQDAFSAYYMEARTNPPGRYKAYVIKGTNEADKLAALRYHLDEQGIAYGFATQRRQLQGFDYRSGTTGTARVEPGDLIISTYQPKAVLTKVLFEPEAALADSLTYDVTAWALPYAYGLDAYALPSRLESDAAALATPAPQTSLLERPYAYLAEWKSIADMRFLAAVLQAGIKLRFAGKPFEVEGRRYERGTLILTRTGNQALGERFDQIVRTAAARLGQPLTRVATGLVTEGADFGSGDVPYLKRPHVAVLAGAPMSSYAVGEIWHFFDQQIGYPVTLLDPNTLGSLDWSDYDVLVLPNGSYGRILTDSRLNNLKAWVRGGGRIVALEGAAAFLAGKDGFNLKTRAVPKDDDDKPKDEPTRPRFGDRDRNAISDDVPGAIYSVDLDHTHPLGFGYDETYFTLKRGSRAYQPLGDGQGWNVGVLAERRSGFVGYKAKDKIAESLVFGVQPMGRGAVVYMLDNPLFRAFWYNGKLLFGNAIFLVGQR